ncbi:hypothetical protein Bbelb_121090 [Branchiostoma belcheri]|nr:hypothetical protein Bbelb_121090 [Branchiostoma belcheri]
MAAASSIADDFDDQLTCALCLDLYEDPKFLPCFHTLCKKCVERLANSSGGRRFKCPVCRFDVELPSPAFAGGVDKLKSNFYINKLLDLRKLRQSKTSRVLCQMCKSGIQAAAVCGDCTKMLCSNCVTAHRNTEELKHHSIITLYDLENPTARSRYARQIHCPKHKDQRMTFYCEPCECLVCIYCTVDDHRAGKNHDPKGVGKVAPKYRTSAESQMKETEAVVSQIRQKVETLDRKLNATAEKCDQVEKEVKQHYEKLISKLQREKQEMITKIHKTKKDRKDELIREKTNMERELENTKQGLAFFTTNNADLTGGKVAPQIEVTSPQGKSTLIQTTAHTSPPLAAGKGQTSRVSRVWGAEWRPQQSGKHTLGVYVGNNNPVLRLGQKGSQQGQFDSPINVAVRGDRLYVADTWNQRVQVFDLRLAVQTDGTIVVKSGKEVKKFSPSGKLLHKFPLGEYCTRPYGLAVQRDGRVVVADKGKHSIFLFEADGTLVFDRDLNYKHKFGQKGTQPQDMWAPSGVSADSRGNIVLANFGGITDGVEHGKKLQVFRPDGTWVSIISSDGDKLNLPHGVAVTEDGHVFVVDAGDHCIRKYRYM